MVDADNRPGARRPRRGRPETGRPRRGPRHDDQPQRTAQHRDQPKQGPRHDDQPRQGQWRHGQPGRAGGPAFVLVTAKLRHPVLRPGTVGRPVLIDRLARDHPRPVVSVVAPAGSGKTTLLAQWADRGESYVTPLVCAAQARASLRRGDVAAARRELVHAQRARPLLTYAIPHLAVQARIELACVHLDVADLAGARSLLRDIGELLRRRPSLGTLAEQAQAVRAAAG